LIDYKNILLPRERELLELLVAQYKLLSKDAPADFQVVPVIEEEHRTSLVWRYEANPEKHRLKYTIGDFTRLVEEKLLRLLEKERHYQYMRITQTAINVVESNDFTLDEPPPSFNVQYVVVLGDVLGNLSQDGGDISDSN